MMDREDLVFATCYQLAQLIADDWDDQPSVVSEALDMLKPIDWPGEVFCGVSPTVNPLELTPTEKEPESLRKRRKLYETKVVCQCFKVILKHSDKWQTKYSDDLKKEIISRIDEYTKEIENLSRAVPVVCDFKI